MRITRETANLLRLGEVLESEGYSPVLVVFLDAAGTSRLLTRDDVDAHELLAFLADATVASGRVSNH